MNSAGSLNPPPSPRPMQSCAYSSTVMKIIPDLGIPSTYKDRSWEGTAEDYSLAIAKSSTLYIGNLSFYTTEEQLFEFFGKFGPVKRVIIGLDRTNRTPCGFCFIEYFLRDDALFCKRNCEGWKLDDRVIRVDWDYGWREGRQFGRGRSGGQVRDEYRMDYDSGRGGWAKGIMQPEEQQQPGESFASQRHNSTAKRNPRFRDQEPQANEQDE